METEILEAIKNILVIMNLGIFGILGAVLVR